MINRENWQLQKAYLKYRLEVDQLSDASIRQEETWLVYLLQWAQERPFSELPKIKPAFPEYMLSARMDGAEGQLSPVYMDKVISAAKRFLEWLLKHRRSSIGKINPACLDAFKMPRLEAEDREHEAVTLDEVRAMAGAPVSSLRDRRIRAAAVFWFLSGIRIGAFVTLPVKAVDLNNKTIYQWPSMGVHTKFGKRGTTFLLDIPELLEVVRAWDEEVRKHLPENSFWFAPLSPDTGFFDAGIQKVGNHRSSRATKDLRDWLDRVGLSYHSPHKFRHGHAVYGLQQSKDIADLKAVSQNLMHANISITDGVYGILSAADVGKRIAGLGNNLALGKASQEDIVGQLIAIAETLKKSSRISGTK